MPLPISLAALTAAVALLGYWIVSKWQRRASAQWAGCYPIRKYPNKEFFGRDYDREYKKAWDDGQINEFALQNYRKCNTSTFEVHTFNEHVIFTMDPTNHQAIATKLHDWIKEDRSTNMTFTGVSILNQNGPSWKRTRELINPLFNQAELKEIERLGKFVDRMVELVPRDGSTIDMQQLSRKLFLDNSTEFVFGESMNCLRDTTGKSDKFIDAFNRAATGAGKRFFPTGLRSYLYRFGTWDDQWLADCNIVHSFVDGCIARHRNMKKQQNLPERQNRYILIDGMSQEISDPVELRFHLLGIFSIARETAPMAFTNVLFMLARHPELWTELRKQAFALVPMGSDQITYEQLKDLTMFRYTVLETFRLRSPVTRNRAVAARDTSLPRGGGPDDMSPVLIPKGSIVFVDKYPASRDPNIWGSDVELFRPSRFEGKRLGWEFTPFSGGPRICPANKQVTLQCMYLLFRLVREFEQIENRDPCWEYVEGVHFCFYSKNGCQVAFHTTENAQTVRD